MLQATFGDKKYDDCRLKLMVQRHLEHTIKGSHFQARNRDEDRPAIGALSKGKAKGKGEDNAKNNSERVDCIRWDYERQIFMKRSMRIQA